MTGDRRPGRPGTDALLVAAGHGDLHAFGVFYDRTAPTVFGLLCNVLGDRARAEQATQRIYLHLWRTAGAFDPTERSARLLLLRSVHPELTGQLHELLTRFCGPNDPTGAAAHN